MKRSEIYHYVMVAVVNSGMSVEVKLKVLKQLMDDESLAEYTERKEAECK